MEGVILTDVVLEIHEQTADEFMESDGAGTLQKYGGVDICLLSFVLFYIPNRARFIRNLFESGLVSPGGKVVIYHAKGDALIPWIQRQMVLSDTDASKHVEDMKQDDLCVADPSYFSEELFCDLQSVTNGTNIVIDSQENNLEARLYFERVLNSDRTSDPTVLYSSLSKCLLQMFCERKLSPEEVTRARTLLQERYGMPGEKRSVAMRDDEGRAYVPFKNVAVILVDKLRGSTH